MRRRPDGILPVPSKPRDPWAGIRLPDGSIPDRYPDDHPVSPGRPIPWWQRSAAAVEAGKPFERGPAPLPWWLRPEFQPRPRTVDTSPRLPWWIEEAGRT